jgi:aminoglycoside/choline kinase family phosphotransferase
MQPLISLFNKISGNNPSSVIKLNASGSNRIYYRLSNETISVIGVKGESITENKAFIALARHFTAKKLPTPQILAYTDDYQYYIQEDLGDLSLFDYMKNGIKTSVFSKEEKNILFKTIELLPTIQYKGSKKLDFSVCYPQAEFDKNTVLWDLNYFKYCFLKPTGIDFSETDLEKDFQQMAIDLLKEKSDTFLYRDFQSRNVMIKDGNPFFIDFQGGRKGPIYYDVASFVWQAKANFPESLRNELIEHYLTALKPYRSIDKTHFWEQLNLFLLFRILQVLGAYGFRGYFEQKNHFLESIPFAINNLRDLLKKNNYSKYPYLTKILSTLCNLAQDKQVKDVFDKTKLTVTIYSFSYKKGIPEDITGNGGGYVFDCRGIHNPGKYEDFKLQTGLNKDVVVFLEQGKDILSFLSSVYKLADAHVENYLQREFSSLMFSFGCTGGQHRSVYAAQRLAEHIASKYGVKVKLIHREQEITQIFNENNV